MYAYREVVNCLALEYGLHVVVEPSVYEDHLIAHPALGQHVYTWRHEDRHRCAPCCACLIEVSLAQASPPQHESMSTNHGLLLVLVQAGRAY